MQIESKQALRAHFLKLRASLSAEEQARASAAMLEFLFGIPAFCAAGQVLTYVSAKGEPDTLALIARCLEQGKEVAVPRCLDKNGTMRFFTITRMNDLTQGFFGICEPDAACERAEIMRDAVCIVPGLAFDENGNRLGYGKGYYDRFLAEFCGVKIGPCYAACLAQRLPAEATDIPVDLVMTENRIYKTTAFVCGQDAGG
ncbi:MAG: 5-formyltetrahydrofolate cyclo-ligase [Oscillospiraceae bacterium]